MTIRLLDNPTAKLPLNDQEATRIRAAEWIAEEAEPRRLRKAREWSREQAA